MEPKTNDARIKKYLAPKEFENYKKQRGKSKTKGDKYLSFIAKGGADTKLKKLQKKKKRPTRHRAIESDTKVLQYIKGHNGIKKYTEAATALGIPRTTLYDAISRLERRGYLLRSKQGQFTITGKGFIFLNQYIPDISYREGCRGDGQLSVHRHHYKLQIRDMSQFDPLEAKERSGALSYKQNARIRGHVQHILYFSDAILTIHTKQVIVTLTDEYFSCLDEAITTGLKIALHYVRVLEQIGVLTEGLMIETAEYERVGSILAEKFEQIDHKYRLKLPDGSWFWIDRSKPGYVCDETNLEETRRNVDHNWEQLCMQKYDFNDIANLKEIAAMMLQREMLRMQMNDSRMAPMPPEQKSIAEYIG